MAVEQGLGPMDPRHLQADPQLLNLHLLRFAAACAVFYEHLMPHIAMGLSSSGGRLDAGFEALRSVAILGVDVFFLISGFLMWQLSAELRGAAPAWEFLRRRIARVYSGYWPFVGLALLLYFVYFPERVEDKNLVLSFSLLPAPWADTTALLPDTLMLPVAWTLIYEIYFYLLLTLLAALGLWHRRWVLPLGIWLSLLATVWAWASDAFALPGLLQRPVAATLYLTPYLLQFLIGAWLARSLRGRRLASPWLFAALAGGGLLVFGWANLVHFQGELISGVWTPQRVVLALPAIIALLLCALSLDQRGRCAFPVLARPLGEATFAIYLLHTLGLLWVVTSGLHAWLVEQRMVISGYLLVSLGIIGLSVLYAHWIDQPLYAAARTLMRAKGRSRLDPSALQVYPQEAAGRDGR